VLQRDWNERRVGTVRFLPKNWRYLDFQYRPDYVNPSSTFDQRVRRAVAHAIDKQAINDGLLEGVGVAADSMMYPTVPYAAELDRSVTKYPFDTRRSEALMQEAGYRKGADGYFESLEGGRMQFQIKGTASPENAAERTILASGWRQAALDTEEGVITPVEARDGQALVTFRSMYASGAPAGLPALPLLTTAQIPAPENRWIGPNRGAWSDPEYDRLVDAVQSTLEPGERTRVIVQAIARMTEQAGKISLYFNPSVHTFPASLQGLDLRAPDADPTWNIHEWILQ
jgi:ABC-type transport system substrate-binding protein